MASIENPDKPAKLCVSNQKGGVGKTTVAINTAAALSDRGHDVLLVDLDPQGNATEALGMADAYDAEPPSLFDCLTDPEQRAAVNEIIRSHEEMDLLPSNIDMAAAEPELTVSRRGAEQLDLLLEEIEKDYDVVVIDSPPNLGNLTDNALFAARNVLIPALAESTSKRAFELLNDHIGSIRLDFDIDIQEVGVVINRIDVRKNQAAEVVDWIETAYDDVPVFQIRERADIQSALEAGESLLAYAPESDMVPEFEAIAEEIEAQLLPTQAASMEADR